MKNYYRVMLGRKSVHAQECFDGGFIGADFTIDQDLSRYLPEDWRKFNEEFRPVFLKKHPEKSKVSAGLACGFLWTVAKGIKEGDVVLCPSGTGKYHVGEVVSGYYYQPGTVLPHRRRVRWYSAGIDRDQMSQALQNSSGSIGTVSEITKYSVEIERLVAGQAPAVLVSTDETVEDPSVFALEEHLEEFLLQNWSHTLLGKNYDIFQEEGELVGQQYPTDTGPIDILAISKDKKEILVVELKKGRASDVVVGQIQRYMGYVQEELIEDGQRVSGIIIALEDDLRLRRSLSIAKNIDFYRYKVNFTLTKA
jgi:restriction system protein